MQPFRASPLGGGAGGGSSNTYYYSPKSATQQTLPVTMVVSNGNSASGRINYAQQGSATVIQQTPPIFQRQQRATYQTTPASQQLYAMPQAPQMITETATYSQQRSSGTNLQGYSTGPALYQTTTIANKVAPTSISQQQAQQMYQPAVNQAAIVPTMSNYHAPPSPAAQTYSYAVQKQYTSPTQLMSTSLPPQQIAGMNTMPSVQYISAPPNAVSLIGTTANSTMPIRTLPSQVVPVVLHQSGDISPLGQISAMPSNLLPQAQITIGSPSTPPPSAIMTQGAIMQAPIYSNQFLPQMSVSQMPMQAPNVVYTAGDIETLMPQAAIQEMSAYDLAAQTQPRYTQEVADRPSIATENAASGMTNLNQLMRTEDLHETGQNTQTQNADPDTRYDWVAPTTMPPGTSTAFVQEAMMIPQNSAVARQSPIEVGSIMPSAHIDLHGVCVNLQEFFEDRSGVLFGVLGAFNPHDTKTTVPLILSNMPSFERLVDFVGCLSVNDPFVIKAWAKKLGVSDQFTFIADSDARFTEALGVGVNLPEKGLGLRCRRFAAVVGPRATFRYVALEEDARADRVLAVLPRFVRTPWKSFLIGISYEDDGVSAKSKAGGSFSTVYQSINDMRNYLADYGFCSESDWQLILSNCLDDVFKPTAENIMSGLKWLVDGAQAGDVLCCYFNGQTVKRIDPNTEEEVLCIKAIDHLDGGLVNLADVAAVLLPAVPENCRLNMIIDGACMSLDLNYCNGECVRDSTSNPNNSRVSRRSNEPTVSEPEGEIFVLEAKKYGAAQALTRLPKFSTYRAVARELSGANVSPNGGESSGMEPVINFWSSRPINLDQELHISDVLDPSEFTAHHPSPSPSA